MTFEELLNEYYAMFGENYPLLITSDLSDEEIISDISRCIESETPAKPVEYEEGVIY